MWMPSCHACRCLSPHVSNDRGCRLAGKLLRTAGKIYSLPFSFANSSCVFISNSIKMKGHSMKCRNKHRYCTHMGKCVPMWCRFHSTQMVSSSHACQAENATACVEGLKQRRCNQGKSGLGSLIFHSTYVCWHLFSKKIIYGDPKKAAICSRKSRNLHRNAKICIQGNFNYVFVIPEFSLAKENKVAGEI